MKVALIGCGAIGSVISGAIAGQVVPVSLELVYDRNKERAQKVCKGFKKKPKIAGSVNEIIDSDVELVIEAASQQAVKLFAVNVLESGKSMMIMSVGALADTKLCDEIKNCAEKNRVKVYLPSGAIGGLDALNSASIGEIYEVTLKTTKHPKGLKDAPYLLEKGIDLNKIKERKILYFGNASEAIKRFPANVNVAAALSLAGIGVDKTRVWVIADPSVDKNIHEIHAKGEFGEFTFKVENVPSPKNPKTSYLAALSAIATLKKITSALDIGT